MSEPTLRGLHSIKTAAEMRAEGATWAVIAEAIGRLNADSARQLPSEWPDLWRAEYDAACDTMLLGAAVKARRTQEELLEPTLQDYDAIGDPIEGKRTVNDPRVRQSAAHSIMSQAMKLRKQRIEVSGAIGASVAIREPTEDELNAQIDTLLQEGKERRAEPQEPTEPES